MMKNKKTNELVQDQKFFVDLSTVSPETLGTLLNVLNAELDEAIVQNRFPTLEGAFNRLIPGGRSFSPSLQ